MNRTPSFLVALVAFTASSVAQAQIPAPPPRQNQAQPAGSAPNDEPPPPPYARPPAPNGQPLEQHTQQPMPTPPPGVPAPAGQWSYTQQYGWLWMPYDQGYTHVVDDAALAYEYVYYPRYGWSWVIAPWVLGYGVTPYWGVHGAGHFAWYAHPWFRVGTAHLRPSWGPGVAGPRGGFHGGGHFGGGRMGGGGHGRR